jgi:type I restriction enzyme M protein
MLYGAIIGDIAGSRFEKKKAPEYNFNIFTKSSRITDDTILTCAIAKSVLDCKGDYSELSNHCITNMKEFANKYPNAGYGSSFINWVKDTTCKPYNSYGNGAAMRISPIAYLLYCYQKGSKKQLLEYVKMVTNTTHNHTESIIGAYAISLTMCLVMSKKYTLEEIKDILLNKEKLYNINVTYKDIRIDRPFSLNFNYKDIRIDRPFSCTCEHTVPIALICALESTSFEDAIRKAVCVGGDTDTIAAMTGSIAECIYDIPKEFIDGANRYLTKDLFKVVQEFNDFIKKG